MSDTTIPDINVGEAIMTAMNKFGSSGANLEDIKRHLMTTQNQVPDLKNIESILDNLVKKGILLKQPDGKYVLKDCKKSRECDTDDSSVTGKEGRERNIKKDENKFGEIEKIIKRESEVGKSGCSSNKFTSKSADDKEKSDKTTRLEENSETNRNSSADTQKYTSEMTDDRSKSDKATRLKDNPHNNKKTSADTQKFTSKDTDEEGKSSKTTRLEENAQANTAASTDTQKFTSKMTDEKGKSDKAARMKENPDTNTKASADEQKFTPKLADEKGKSGEDAQFEKFSHASKNSRAGAEDDQGRSRKVSFSMAEEDENVSSKKDDVKNDAISKKN